MAHLSSICLCPAAVGKVCLRSWLTCINFEFMYYLNVFSFYLFVLHSKELFNLALFSYL